VQIVYSHPYLVFVSSLSLFYLSTVLSLNLPISGHRVLPGQQKLTILFQTYILTWILLFGATILLSKLGVGGGYFISAWNAVVLLGGAVGYLEEITGAKGLDMEPDREGGEDRIAVRGVRYDGEDGEGGPEHEEVETEPTEITPLIQQRRLRWPSTAQKEGGAIGWWILQLLIVVPVPVILASHIAVLVVGAMSQTLSDGDSPAISKLSSGL
jgi:hypothetical protein